MVASFCLRPAAICKCFEMCTEFATIVPNNLHYLFLNFCVSCVFLFLITFVYVYVRLIQIMTISCEYVVVVPNHH